MSVYKSFVSLLLLCSLWLSATAQEPLRYEVSFPNAEHHEARIRVHFNHLPEEVLAVRMARSSPGRYALHEFAKNVYDVKAFDGEGNELEVYRPDPYEWQVAGHNGEVFFEYTLFADRIDGTYAAVNERQAHLNIPATFAYSEDLKYRPIEVAFKLDEQENWKVATQLKQLNDTAFYAPNLYYFMDSPVQAGDFDVRNWTSSSNGKDYEIQLVLHHEGTEEELDRYAEWTRRIVEEQKLYLENCPILILDGTLSW
ncbi:M61 family metallopeptidase [Nafulsella turpanensis]|uniref:M61 family metallopeptidase n=1 Tax=Nafulsella turpanensis TaxID=1265690 RepID=UPI00034AF3CF|nr:hypothetical protein [Nafulsella turpanensis]